ncbi:folate-binding protein [Actinophytocola sp.]|uniref:CAF17-like 4Fe-4S cluster assembly/insertion protein YgfZ n=1 Tax=Actinophytocola sp. TaxID=1872138 RepID=UPI002ED117B4
MTPIPAPEGSPDIGVPWHYGDPFAEQRAAARRVAVVDRSNREVIAVTGPERLSWLHLVISQHMTELADGTATEALVLDSQGRVDTHMEVAHHDETVWLDTDPGAHATGARGGQQPLLEYLRSMVFWSKVELRDATSERAVLTLLGPETDDLLTKVTLPVPGPHEVAGAEGVLVRRGALGVDLLVPRDDHQLWWDRLTANGARPMGSWGYEAFRVEAGRPRMDIDTDERTIPHEVGWVHVAAHVAKGCYRGQETVAKVHNVGRPPRRMLLLHLDGSPEVLPETGDPVVNGERTVGRVGSVVRHHELGPIALALVKYSVPLDTELLAGQDDRVVQAAIDPDLVPEATPGLGREAARRLRG